jgi:hypothetical protein
MLSKVATAPSAHARSFPLSALSRRDGFPVLVRLRSALRPVASGFVGEGSGGFRLVSLRLKAKNREGAPGVGYCQRSRARGQFRAWSAFLLFAPGVAFSYVSKIVPLDKN